VPTISVGCGLNRSASLGPEGDLFVFDPRNRGRSFSVQASWNLFSGFDRREGTAQASASRTRARADRTRRRIELEKEVRDAVAEIRRRAERLEILRRRADLARQRMELAREQYRLGTFDYLQLQNAVGAVAAAEEGLLRERYDYMIAWADLEERVGGVR
jgi:outer membrane protein TolC